MKVRFFAAAAAAAGVKELDVPLQDIEHDGGTLAALLGHLPHAVPATGASGPPLHRVLSRSSFLVNEIGARDESRPLADADVIDVLPPFAGG
ncbi:MAG: MoaD/ThiS family protein [Arthrobacter sp.]|uniref:MoaD/ThiS family protein n=1 Tax=unclassified Arthrobacter TaxID=235627 RepID=UPI0026518C6E|nr:MoaD/ThiS family protein [Micrococcaceae bacterium]MDN5812563.1 MoaD/ThiS family protein [Micrococcaceae bacterium]MDN5823707.1 MoaD/ThiS family protein [Micrococcaceae bacterium]MDN5878095.1 MoaD/ThiS family protein [Micrococcaceae bacterium]MDN5886823.1 MoaD/ThiS family protein [Micrococcaceae bacterium]